jgi:hypothetical protein
MNTQKLNDWLQLAAGVGVIAGLLMVAWEINQNAQLTRVQLNSDTFTGMEELARSLQQEPLALALAKSYETPEKLAAHELIILDGFYREAYMLVFREWVFIERGVYEDNLDSMIRIFSQNALGSDNGRVWWSESKYILPGARIRARIDQYVADYPPENSADRIGRMQEILQINRGQ